MVDALLGTTNGLFRLHDGALEPLGLDAHSVTAVHATDDALLAGSYGDGLFRSADGGETWVCEPVAGDEDVHHVTGHPDDPDLVYVSLGSASLTRRGGQHGGIARSRDGGRTWEKVETDYTRATLVPAARPDLLLAGPAIRVGRGGRIVGCPAGR